MSFICNSSILVGILTNIKNIFVFIKHHYLVLNIIKSRKVIIARYENLKSNLYEFENLIKKIMSVIRKDNPHLWHCQLRHLYYYGLSHLSKINKIVKMLRLDDVKTICEECQAEK